MRFMSIMFYVLSSSLHYDQNNTRLCSARFVTSLTPGARSSGIICHKSLYEKRTRNTINVEGKGCQLIDSIRHAIIWLPFI